MFNITLVHHSSNEIGKIFEINVVNGSNCLDDHCTLVSLEVLLTN